MQCACIAIVVVVHVGHDGAQLSLVESFFYIYPAAIIYPLSSLKLVPNDQL